MLNYDHDNKCRKLTNIKQYKTRFSLIVEQILAFCSNTNLFRKGKNLYPTINYPYSYTL